MRYDNPIEKIRARLDGGNKWHKGSYGTTAKGGGWDSVCIMGAACETEASMMVRHEVYVALEGILKEQYPDRVGFGGIIPGRIPSFNDHPDTTFADVELVLEKGALIWEESRAGV